MNDLVKRLRLLADAFNYAGAGDAANLAADRIEQLEAAYTSMDSAFHKRVEEDAERIKELEAERDRYRRNDELQMERAITAESRIEALKPWIQHKRMCGAYLNAGGRNEDGTPKKHPCDCGLGALLNKTVDNSV